jgi:hypothetical protein
MKKITLRTVKAFINKHRHELQLKPVRGFGNKGMALVDIQGEFKPVKSTKYHLFYTLGINEAWFVGNGCDYIDLYSRDDKTGYEVYNACGSFILAVDAPLWKQRCFHTHKGINEGWVFSGETFSSQRLATKEIKRCGWNSYAEAYENNAVYWTSWENEPPQYREEADGTLNKIAQDLHI